jgi:hypothetical protein
MPAQRRLGTVDLATGEVLDGVVVHLPRRKASPYGDRWMTLNQPPWLTLATDPEITVQTYRVLIYVLSYLDYDNWCVCSPSQIGPLLRMRPQHVSTQLRLLAAKGVLLAGPVVGRVPSFRLSPVFGWRGRQNELRRILVPEDLLAGRRTHYQEQRRAHPPQPFGNGSLSQFPGGKPAVDESIHADLDSAHADSGRTIQKRNGNGGEQP